MNRATQSNMEQAILFWFALIIFCCCRLTETAMITKPGCPEKCGNVTIPYPFGIGAECSIPTRHSGFLLKCNDSFTPHRITSTNDQFQIYNISDTQIHVSNYVAFSCYNTSGVKTHEYFAWIDLRQSPFSFSNQNIFTLFGCDDYARIFGESRNRSYTFGCMSICSRASDATEGECPGFGCCQVSVPKGLRSFSISLGSFGNHTEVVESNSCGFGFLAKQDSFRFGGLSDLQNPVSFWNTVQNSTPIVLDWAIGDLKCSQAQNQTDFACRDNTICVDTEAGGGGYRCECRQGFQGNPYLEPGCQDIDECLDSNLNDCAMNCNNTLGSYTCWCPDGYDGDGLRSRRGCIARPSLSHATTKIVLGLTCGMGSLSLFLVCILGHKIVHKRNKERRKQLFFKRNGGLLLQQGTSMINNNAIGNPKHFHAEELEKATDNFNKNRVLGQGGQGIVYKGMFPDGKVVAIKKSKLIDETRMEQFINEVVILSQINHKNIVKLLGCCLETEVPLLIYEFVPNGTLCDLINEKNSEFPISWNMRLKIAADIAGALAYLHSATTIPVYHRDVKTSNILLDERYIAKVSDFGISKSIEIDQTHLTTIVRGTFGYLDPEYFQSSKFTDKSDVYSFGVVLIELLTGQRPLSFDRIEEERSLATKFLMCMECNSLDTILAAQVLEHEEREEVLAVAQLAQRCLNLSGKKRPTMKEVAATLENVRKVQIPEAKLQETKSNEDESIAVSRLFYPWTDGDIVRTSSTLEEHPLIFYTK